MRWTREALEARVDALHDEHRGAALVAAVAAFSEQLDADERALLGDVLLARAQAAPPSLEAVRKDGWLRRQLRPRDRR